MAKITISYRRADSDAIAGRIRDRLARHYGDDAVFMDIDNIPLGVDFRTQIRETLSQVDILLVVIGPQWRGPLREGKFRIFDETDPCRVEVEQGLEREIATIPILVNGATMPSADELPETLRPLSFRNAATVDAGRARASDGAVSLVSRPACRNHGFNDIDFLCHWMRWLRPFSRRLLGLTRSKYPPLNNDERLK